MNEISISVFLTKFVSSDFGFMPLVRTKILYTN